MRVENKRIFICDLPETTTQDDLQNAFNNYGSVTSVEIKERKELGLKNNSLFFAFANVDIDDRSLQSCFKDFANGKWFGEHVVLQVARESFLDRLKREREESSVLKKETSVSRKEGSDSWLQPRKIDVITTNTLKQEKLVKYKSVDSSNEDSESSSDEDVKSEILKRLNGNNLKTDAVKTEKQNQVNASEVINLVIKNNKGKLIDKNGLKIESVGKSPILIIDASKKKATVNPSEANLRRLQSLNNLKKAHKTQKSVIQQALSKIDSNPKKKIVFDDTESHGIQESTSVNKKSKKSLFDEDHQEDDFEPNFEIKEQFQGEKGQKLLELQARYKNDKRFNLDARFLADDDQKETDNQAKDNEEMDLEEEKKKEYEILEQVLGRKVIPKSQHKKFESESQKKVMLRFDPTQPDHSKFELKNEVVKEKKKRKRENAESDLLNEKKQEEKDTPNVSKEIFYKVTEDLKDSLKEKQEFSLLSMFGKADEEPNTEEASADTKITSTGISNNFIKEKNPFRYDSSDDEDETDDIPSKEKAQSVEKPLEANTPRRSAFWSEPFFFTDDDYRLQEGVDFVEKMSTKEESDFTKLRRNLKEIVKAKVRNNQRKNRPFKKKLGGSKKKKMLRIKKALKR